MVIEVNVGHIWELPRLSACAGTYFECAKTRGWGEARPPRDDNFALPTHSLRRE